MHGLRANAFLQAFERSNFRVGRQFSYYQSHTHLTTQHNAVDTEPQSYDKEPWYTGAHCPTSVSHIRKLRGFWIMHIHFHFSYNIISLWEGGLSLIRWDDRTQTKSPRGYCQPRRGEARQRAGKPGYNDRKKLNYPPPLLCLTWIHSREITFDSVTSCARRW